MYNPYNLVTLILRRTVIALLVIVTFPVMVFMPNKAKFYSVLHRAWIKTSNKPVWLSETERAARQSHG